MGQYQFLIDKISVFLAYNIGDIDNICYTGILYLCFFSLRVIFIFCERLKD